MPGNRITNKPLSSMREAMAFYVSFLDDFDLSWKPGVVSRELRLVSQQYQRNRSRLQSLSSFSKIEKWLNSNQLALMTVPASAFSHIKHSPFLSLSIIDVQQTNVSTSVGKGCLLSTGEDVEGPGWTGTIVISPTKHHSSWNGLWARIGLVHMGIYAFPFEFDRRDNKPLYSSKFYMLERDFTIPEIDPLYALNGDSLFNNYDDMDEDKPLTQGEYMAQLAEEGDLDYEIDFKGFDQL